MKHTVTLEIAGTKFRLVADADAHHLNALASLVNERVAKLSATGRPASAAQLLALVALGLADDLTTSEKKLKEVEQLTRTTIQQVIARIDSRLAASASQSDSEAHANAQTEHDDLQDAQNTDQDTDQDSLDRPD